MEEIIGEKMVKNLKKGDTFIFGGKLGPKNYLLMSDPVKSKKGFVILKYQDIHENKFTTEIASDRIVIGSNV